MGHPAILNMNFLRLNAAISEDDKANHSPSPSFSAKRLCQYASIPRPASPMLATPIMLFDFSCCSKGLIAKRFSVCRCAVDFVDYVLFVH